MVQSDPKRMRPCELYLVRHAVAAERGDDWPDDDKRPLTSTGVSRFREVVKGLAWFDVGLDEIYSSPLVRARQTAELLSAGMEGKPSVRTLDALSPGHEPAEVLAELATRVKRRRRTTTLPAMLRRSRYIPDRVREEVFERDGHRCTYVDPLTQRRCEATYYLQPHHLHAYAKGGSNEPENLGTLCSAHNQYEAYLEFGEEKLRRSD
jgi:5-methylcytosine-specific restriction endonuclease McrA